MKYFAIILLSLSVAMPAYAAKTVTGTVPIVPPLQPPTAGAAPNYSGNIQHYEPGRTVGGGGNPAALGNPPGGSLGQPQGAPSGIGNAPGSAQNNKPIPWPAIIILLVGVAGALGYWRYGRKSRI